MPLFRFEIEEWIGYQVMENGHFVWTFPGSRYMDESVVFHTDDCEHGMKLQDFIFYAEKCRKIYADEIDNLGRLHRFIWKVTCDSVEGVS